ncbi:MAG: imidazole glycerol phosphate synthase subunit HisH [Clostridiales Family XIII bacterium]|jgi:glutamine amidotransferase|nr:imidazole glycerol phosphate synthase subunit HisH [Clostridiales Family XIII bacterium]
MKVAVIDYGAGNLFSVMNALRFLGCEGAALASGAQGIEAADKLILPGVGAFPDAMRMLRERGLVEAIKEAARAKPLLGICLGMQVLFEKGYEFEETCGLGLIEGYVDRIVAPGLKIPHMGWSDVRVVNPSALTAPVADGDRFYFVHSYKAVTGEGNICLAAEYGQQVPALVRQGGGGHVYGAQFHPEKSGRAGLRILERFLAL